MSQGPLSRADHIAPSLGLFFAVRTSGVFFFVHVLGLNPSTASALILAFGPAFLAAMAFHSYSASAARYRDRQTGSTVWAWLGVYLVYIGLSLLWGQAVSPTASFAYWCGLVLDVVLVWALLCCYPSGEVVFGILRGYVLGACLIAALAWCLPAQADLRLGDPEFLNTNQIANLCALGIFSALLTMRLRRVALTPALVFLSITLLRSLSKATLIAFACSMAYFLWRDPLMSRRKRAGIVFASIACLLLFSGLFAAYYDVYTRAGNQAETFTGRTAIWAWSIARIPDAPWFGHGFDSMWKVIPPLGPDRFQARHAENEVLQQVYNYGVIGLLFAAGVYVSLLLRINRIRQSAVRTVLQSLVLYIWVRGLVEAEPFDLLMPLWSIALLSSSAFELGQQSLKSSPVTN